MSQKNYDVSDSKKHPLSLVIKMIWLGIGMAVIFHLMVTVFTKHYLIVTDLVDESLRCIPKYSVYLLKRNYGEIESGKIYTFKAKNMEPLYPDNTLISKYVAGVPSDSVVQNEHGVFINGKVISTGYPSQDKLNKSESHFYTSYTLDNEKYFFTAPAERSFDSRYWGTVDKSQIIGEAIPLW